MSSHHPGSDSWPPRSWCGRGRSAGAVVGVGVDAVDLDRFRRVLGRRAHLADRLFTGAERAYARAASDPVPRLSTRFAAKEATMKALGVGLGAFPFAEVEVVRTGPRRPDPGPARIGPRRLARRAGVARWHLSLTHTDRVALALVVAEGGAPAGGPAAPRRPRAGPRSRSVVPMQPVLTVSEMNAVDSAARPVDTARGAGGAGGPGRGAWPPSTCSAAPTGAGWRWSPAGATTVPTDGSPPRYLARRGARVVRDRGGRG